MLLAWMVYGVTFGFVVCGGVLLLERVIRSHSGSTRKLWLAAMVGTVLVPIAAWLGLGPGTSAFAAETFRNASPVLQASEGLHPGAILLSGVLGFLWTCASAVIAASLLVQAFRVRRGRREWSEAKIDGTAVLLSDDVGPAVVGFGRSRIVLPKWVVDADPSVCRLILDHEREHLRGRDPLLLLAAILMVVAMPWNFTLWWMAHRLRLAVEVDCDERVLSGGSWDVRTYGSLLLSVGRRRSRPGYSLAAFSRPRSSLEHRILEMTRPAMSGRWARSGAVLVAVLALVFTAFALPAPNTLAHWTTSGYWCELDDEPINIYDWNPGVG